MVSDKEIINQTKQWIEKIVIGLNFCPFAKKVFDKSTIFYFVDKSESIEKQLENIINKCELLDSNKDIETGFIIYPAELKNFNDYLYLLELANRLIIDCGYEGTYQLASFHPQYCFEGVSIDAAENYTNRSPYPMLHLIREKDLEKAITGYQQADKIPQRNIELAKNKGASYFIEKLTKIKQRI